MKVIYLLVIVMIFSSVSSFAQTKTDTLKVWGNCEECKNKIEKAAKKGGAASADWNDETYKLVINYNADKTSALNIEKEIASVGYDTQDIKASEEAYKKLPRCCQYIRGDKNEKKQNNK